MNIAFFQGLIRMSYRFISLTKGLREKGNQKYTVEQDARALSIRKSGFTESSPLEQSIFGLHFGSLFPRGHLR